MQLRVHRDGYVLGSEFVSDLVEGEHKKEEHKHGHKDEHKDLKGRNSEAKVYMSVGLGFRIDSSLERSLFVLSRMGSKVNTKHLFTKFHYRT